MFKAGELTGRLYVEWQPVHEGVADKLGEEETQRELHYAGNVECIDQADGLSVCRVCSGSLWTRQDGRAFCGRRTIANLILQREMYTN